MRIRWVRNILPLTNWSATSFTEFECWGVRCAVASPARALKIADRSQSMVRLTACDPRSVPTPEHWIQKEQCHRGIWRGALFLALFPSYLKAQDPHYPLKKLLLVQSKTIGLRKRHHRRETHPIQPSVLKVWVQIGRSKLLSSHVSQ